MVVERSPAEFANSALANDDVREKRNHRERSHTGVGPTSSKHALTLDQPNSVGSISSQAAANVV